MSVHIHGSSRTAIVAWRKCDCHQTCPEVPRKSCDCKNNLEFFSVFFELLVLKNIKYEIRNDLNLELGD